LRHLFDGISAFPAERDTLRLRGGFAQHEWRLCWCAGRRNIYSSCCIRPGCERHRLHANHRMECVEMAMIEIPCPNCDAALGRVDEAFRLFMFPHIACPCGFSGPFNWVNPRLGISVEEAISRLESRRNSSHIADTALHSESPASTGHKAPL